ncbi:MAG: hypothetical protein P8I51_04275 [Polaribacter sp.]|nr:hypothetical protein [Polaribacter sp.]
MFSKIFKLHNLIFFYFVVLSMASTKIYGFSGNILSVLLFVFLLTFQLIFNPKIQKNYYLTLLYICVFCSVRILFGYSSIILETLYFSFFSIVSYFYSKSIPEFKLVKFINFILFLHLFISIYSLYDGNIFGLVTLPVFELYDIKLFSGAFGNPNNNGMLFILIQFLLVIKFKSIHKFQELICVICIFLSGSRYLLIVSLLLFCFTLSKKYLFYTLLTVIGFTLILYKYVIEFVPLYSLKKLSSFTSNQIGDSGLQRVDFLFKFFKLEWFPFGVSNLKLMNSAYKNSHSLLIDFSFIFGLFGFLLILYIFIHIYKTSVKFNHLSKFKAGIITVLIFTSCFIPSSIIYSPFYFILFGFLSNPEIKM